MIVLLVVIFIWGHLCFSERIVSLNGNTQFDNWVAVGSFFDHNDETFKSLGSGSNNKIDGDFWKTSPARRLILKISLKPSKNCTNQNDTSCLIRLALWRGVAGATPVYTDTNITFPEEPYFNTSSTITTTASINRMSAKEGIYFQFQLFNFEGIIMKPDLSYVLCSNVTENLADFPEQAAPDEIEKELNVTGTCVTNADANGDTPYMKCRSNGSYEVIGECFCKAGYELKDSQCQACAEYYFKSTKGNTECIKCGANSKVGIVPRTTCACIDEWHVKALDKQNDPKADCYAYPRWTNVSDFKVSFSNIKNDETNVSWSPPSPGSAMLGSYVLQCKNCPSELNFTVITNNTNILLTKLSSLANYIIEITNINNITELTGKTDTRTFRFTTAEGAPGIIQNARNTTHSNGSVRFIWDKPFGLGSKDYIYVVTYGDVTLRQKENTFLIETDIYDRQYTVKIFAEATVNNVIMKGDIYQNIVTVKGGLISLNGETLIDNWETTNNAFLNSNDNTFVISQGGINDGITTDFWETTPARRLILKISLKPSKKCTNQNDTSCLIRLALWRGNRTNTPIQSAYTDTNITFPEEPYFDTSSTITTTASINKMYKKEGIIFRFRTFNFQGKIEKVDLSFFMCPQVTEKLVDFPEQAAPDEIEKELNITGTCTTNADLQGDTPYMKCRYDRSYEVIGGCVCKAGYQPKDRQCKACDEYYFKSTKGNTECIKCGANSKIGVVPRTTCACIDDWHVKSLDKQNDPKADCYAYPRWTSVNNFKVSFSNIKNDETNVSWSPPSPGSAMLGSYVLQCKNCPSELNFTVITNNTNILLTKLSSFADYIIEITNINNITELTGKTDRRTFNFTTAEGAPGIIQKPTYTTLSDGSVQFTWDRPFGLGSKDYIYVVTYGDTTLRQKENTFVIKTDTQDRKYTVRIVTEAIVNSQTRKGKVYEVSITVNGGITLEIALAVAFGVLIFVVVALIVAFCVWKRRNPAYLQVVRMPDGTVKLPARFYSGGKVYVDPKTYPDLDEAVNVFANEIESDEMKVGEKIGEGEFCDVYKGKLFTGGRNYNVAIKMLKEGASKEDRDDFLSEAAILGQFSHPNVITLQGVILKDEPNAILLEYMSCGSLDKYLQEHDNEFTTVELLEMGQGIAYGMKYLSEIGFIHRDLAARNILVNENRVCKIADFGMSVEIKFDEASESTSGKIPVRWTAPEAIQFKQFTTASDVWSYGIVLWEIMSYGERPYWNWTNYEVLEKITGGYRLPPPMSCPGVVHDLMLQCWTKDRTRRPLFSIIREKLDMWIRHPELLEGSTIIELDDNLDYTIMQTINKWLEAIQMGRYSKNFIEQGFATPRQILLLTSDDLERLGIGALDHRKRIMKAIENTRKQVESQVVRTSSVIGNSYAV